MRCSQDVKVALATSERLWRGQHPTDKVGPVTSSNYLLNGSKGTASSHTGEQWKNGSATRLLASATRQHA